MIGFYNKFFELLAKGELDLHDAGSTIKCLLLRSTGAYTFNATHVYVADLISNGAVEISVASYLRQTLGNKVVTGVNADCDNIEFGLLESGQIVSAFVLYKHITNDADSILLLHNDGKIKITAAAPALASPIKVITDITNDNPGVVTATSHGFSDGDKVYISGVTGMTEVNDRVFTVFDKTTHTFKLLDENTSAYSGYINSGEVILVRTVYIEKLKYAVPDRATVDFGGSAQGSVNGLTAKNSRVLEVIELGDDITEGDDAEDVQTIINLPATLGGGEFNINIGTAMFIGKNPYA
jgi:hypothetical protein